MTVVGGVDGCKAGWIVVLRDIANKKWQIHLCSCFDDVLNLRPQPDVIALDVPIGLLDTPVSGGRVCDQDARTLLGQPRRNSVFSPPSRPALQCESFAAASQLNQPAGLTQQAFGLFPKLRQVDVSMTPNHQSWVREVHPEVCFYAANGNVPMLYRKKSSQGREERLQVLATLYGEEWNGWWIDAAKMFLRKHVALDDIIDAHIAAWTAERICRRTAVRVTDNPPTDSKGLRMDVWY